MALAHKTRRRLALLVLVVGLPIYIVAASSLVTLFERPPILVELGIYVLLGILWALPLKALFKGVGRGEPGSEDE
ncbi:DUF2842 domain-containing protein [Roseivivax sp. CAU 1761]